MTAGGHPDTQPGNARTLLPGELGYRFSYRHDATVPDFPDDRPLIVFDGVCVMCSGFAQFVAARDPQGHFRFATAQSGIGNALFRHYGLDPDDFETNLLIEDGHAWGRMEAFARIMARLGFPWSLSRVVLALPRGPRDWLYERIARNRYRLFGRRETCVLPSAFGKDRFVA
ncbi:MAG: thiol-disulfide oxidoreductase DCC family protein [Hyphomicrobiales bacterium]